MRFCFSICAVLILLVRSVHADWPQFRGPNGDGHSDVAKLPLEWGPKKEIAWVQDIPGKGWSSPVGASGKVYLTSAVKRDDSDDLSLRAICLDARTGKILWNVEVFQQQEATAPKIHIKNSHASPTPILTQDRLFVHFGHQGTACLDLKGTVLWRNRELRYAPVHGNGGSPILLDDLLVFSTDGSDVREVVALEARTGKLRWRSKRSGEASRRFSFSTPQAILVDGSKQIISPGSDMVGAYEPGTGKEIWKVRYKGYSVIPRPVTGHGLVYICTGYDAPTLLAIRPTGKGDVTDSHVAWTVRTSVPHTPSLLLHDKELYMVSDRGVASCLDALTGKLYWSQRLGGVGYSASPLLAGGHLYFLSEDGITTVIKPGRTFQRVARNEIHEKTLASFAVLDASLFLRTAERLYRIGK